MFMKYVKRLFVHDVCEELKLANMAAFLFFFSKTVVSHMPNPRKILRSNDGTKKELYDTPRIGSIIWCGAGLGGPKTRKT